MSCSAILVDATGFHPVTVPYSAGRVQYQRAWYSGFRPQHSPLTVFELTPFTLKTGAPECVVTSLPPSLCSSLCLYPLILLLFEPPSSCAPLPYDVFTRLLHESSAELGARTQQSQLMLRSTRPSHGVEEVARRVKRLSSSSGAVSVVSSPSVGGGATVIAAPTKGRKARRPKKSKDVSEESEANDVCELLGEEEEEEDVGDGDDDGGDEEEDGEDDEDEGDDADDGGEEEDGGESELNEEEEEELCDDSGMEEEEEEEVCEPKVCKKARVSNV